MSNAISANSTNNVVNSYASTSTSSSSSSSFAEILSSASDLLLAQNNSEKQYKPSLKEFIDATGASLEEAQVVYVDDGRETRDWAKIMADTDPLKAARTATQQMYNDVNREKTIGTVPDELDVYAKTQNFLYYHTDDGADRLAMTDNNGVILRHLSGDIEHVKNDILNFGFDTAQLGQLQSMLTEKDISSPMIGETSNNLFLDLNAMQTYVNKETVVNAQQQVESIQNEKSIDLIESDKQLLSLFHTYFDREPSTDGFAFWSQRLKEGASLQDIEHAFSTSTEYMLKTTSYTQNNNKNVLATTSELSNLLKVV